MRQQNAGAISIQFGTLQQRAEKLRVMYSCVMHADELQSIDFHLFVIQNPDAGARHGIEIAGAAGEFLMIACDKINSRRGGNVYPRFKERIKVRFCPVKQSAADEDSLG